MTAKLKTWICLVVSILLISGPAFAADLVIAGRDGIYGKALEQSVKAFKKEHPGLNIQLLKLPYGNLYEKLVVSLRGGSSAYDVLMLDDTWATEFMKNGWLADLKETDPDFIPAALDISRYPVNAGRLYSLPFVGNVEMFAYRQDLFSKYGFDKPGSWSNVLQAAQTINSKEKGVNGVVFRGTKGNPIVTGFLPILWAHGGSLVDADGKAAINSKAGLQALNMFLKLKSYAPAGVELYNSTEVRDSLQQSKAAIAIEVWPSWIPSMDDPQKSKVVDKMAVIAAPGEIAGPSPMLGIWQLAITRGASHATLAREFIDFVTSGKNQKSLVLDLGLPPTRKSVYTDKQVVSKFRWYPNQLAALSNGKPRPRITQWKKVESIMGDYLQLALVGQMSPKRALKGAHKDIARALR